MIQILHHNKEIASFFKDRNDYAINYSSNDIVDSIALSLPNSQKLYRWEHHFPPYLESFLPEGYLYEIFKNLLAKEYGEVNDYLIYSLLASNIENRMSFQSNMQTLEYPTFNIEEILENDTADTFNTLLQTFLNKNAIGGVQPKTLVIVKNKESLILKEHIVKTWGEEFPYLAENEYFCLKALEKAGINIPKIELSKNKRFLLVEKFIYREDHSLWGFEEVISLLNKNRDKKYSGSYEQVAKIVYNFSTNKQKSMEQFFKTIVMNFLLKNGDAHLKNFGLLFSDDFREIKFAPAYDVVNTVVYIYKDKPALTLGGKKIWWSKKELLKFAQKQCYISKSQSEHYYDACFKALQSAINDLEEYVIKHEHFSSIGQKMLDIWRLSLKEEDMKEVDNALIRSWKTY